MQRMVIVFLSMILVMHISSGVIWAQTQQTTEKIVEAKSYENSRFLISAETLWRNQKDPRLRIVDVRSEEEYMQGHLPGALHLPMSRITIILDHIPGILAPKEVVEKAFGTIGLTNESWVVIYDAAGGNDATRLFWVLDYYGHKDMAVLDGGLAAWKAANYPITTTLPQISQAVYQGTPDPTKLATGKWILNQLSTPEVFLIDTRSRAEFEGKRSGSGTRIAGHIPGAVNIEWVRNLTTTIPHKILPPETLQSLYESIGVSQDTTVVVYSQSGMRASHTYFVLRLLGYPHVRLYDGSWLEWANSGRFPIRH